jgi:hypothetical protein
MKTTFLASVCLASVLVSQPLLADDDDCVDPVADWQPREILRQQVERYGWDVHRIKVDDGCYEVRATESKGNRVRAVFAPATLRIRSLKIDFRPTNGDASDYLRVQP